MHSNSNMIKIPRLSFNSSLLHKPTNFFFLFLTFTWQVESFIMLINSFKAWYLTNQHITLFLFFLFPLSLFYLESNATFYLFLFNMCRPPFRWQVFAFCHYFLFIFLSTRGWAVWRATGQDWKGRLMWVA